MSSSSSSSSSGSASPEPSLKRRREGKSADGVEATQSSSSDSDSSDEDDAPALSHAEKRRQKKKEKLAARKDKGLEPPPSKKRKTDNQKEATDSTSQRQNSVWVGNLSFKTTPDALRKFFEGVGEITRINLPMKVATRPNMPGENRGFAYVDFATADAKNVAIALSEKPLLGRKLLIKDGDDFAGRPAAPDVEESLGGKTHSKTALKILRIQKQPPAPTLFFGNLPFETTEDNIRQLLDAHRKKPRKDKDSKKEEEDVEEEKDEGKGEKEEENWIRKIRLGTFEDSGLCKGFAFVDFSSTDNATSALINPKNHHLNGRNLVVEYASADAVKRGPNKPRAVAGEGGPGDFKRKFGPRVNGSQNKPFRRNERDVGAGDEKSSNRRKDRLDYRHNAEESQTVDHEEFSTPQFGGRPYRKDQEGVPRHKGPRNRPKPGAALAQAKRQSAAIVPTSGKKIVF
ncbi:uncharacterized protein C8R40DRAFT_1042862 [Lentinula edodes]|uniref:uncharacterized protein n=1 Tax=Lentinula edodes TaxID=5353 RepID=UPI001E8EA3CB|nr:uncharacterized protein C8R40DRAFT_1042862 [Lentinula edodes]KAH7876429.1 hypothetical protein C8R40DRAFT_1042862 [Lentinula edodes]